MLKVNISIAQEKMEEPIIENVERGTSNTEWVPTLLNANRNVLFSLAAFNGAAIGWKLRGVNEDFKTGGISWHSPLMKWRASDLFAGMQNNFQEAFRYENFTYETFHALELKKSLKINSAFSNTIYTNLLHTNYNSGLLANQWAFGAEAALQYAPPGIAPLGYKQSVGLLLSADKILKKQIHFGLNLIWNMSDASRSTVTVQEMFALAGRKLYSPNWGWYQQQYYYTSTKQSNAPVFSMRLEKQLGQNSFISWNNAFVIGLQSQSSLEWTNTADPRPDYYKYLPSYIQDTALSNALTVWYKEHPELLQLQLDRLSKINQSASDKQSFYIVNQQNEKLFLVHGAVSVSHAFSTISRMNMGFHYAIDQIHYSNTLKDLLGGSYFLNYNAWVNDDGLANSFQNDLQHPDRKIRQGDNWGADYSMRSYQFNNSWQFAREGPRVESKISFAIGTLGIQRIGFNQNGLFPVQSKGTEEIRLAPEYNFKYQLLYKLSGRFYLRSFLIGEWIAPPVASVYFNSELHSIRSPYAVIEMNKEVDLSAIYRSPLLNATISFYWNEKENESTIKTFYHDGFSKFVHGVVGGMHSIANGMEASFETNLFSNIQIAATSTFQEMLFANNPHYSIFDVNNLQILNNGLLDIKSLPATTSPSWVNALTLQSQPLYSIRIGLTFLYAQNRAIAIDYFRRSEIVKKSIDAYSWNQIRQVNYLPDRSVINAYLSKSFQQKLVHKILRWTTSLSVRDLFNNGSPVIAFEQNRFDYLHFNSNKYAVKYLMGQGCNYSLHIQLQIQ